VADVAAAMGTSPNTVKTQLRRALEAMRRRLSELSVHGAAIEVTHG
jgi:DNA-directed RNA polymerase specialized sigma24 family protein